MRVVRVIAYRVRMPLRKAFSHARASRAVADNIVVEAAAESGTRGYGEGVPREYVTGETPESGDDGCQVQEQHRHVPRRGRDHRGADPQRQEHADGDRRVAERAPMTRAASALAEGDRHAFPFG